MERVPLLLGTQHSRIPAERELEKTASRNLLLRSDYVSREQTSSHTVLLVLVMCLLNNSDSQTRRSPRKFTVGSVTIISETPH